MTNRPPHYGDRYPGDDGHDGRYGDRYDDRAAGDPRRNRLGQGDPGYGDPRYRDIPGAPGHPADETRAIPPYRPRSRDPRNQWDEIDQPDFGAGSTPPGYGRPPYGAEPGYGAPAYGAPGYGQTLPTGDPRLGSGSGSGYGSGYGPPGYPPQGPHLDPRRDPRVPLRRPPARPAPQRASGKIVAGRVISTILSTVLVAGAGLAWSAVGGTPSNASEAPNQAGTVGLSEAVSTTTDAEGNVVTVPIPTNTKGTNILIVGSDARTDAEGNRLTPAELKALSTGWDGGGVSTDTLMIVHVPGNGTKATAISIPRDAWMDDSIVHAPGVVGPYSDGTEGVYKANKINSFYGTAKTYEREYLVSKGVSDEAELERRSSEAGRTMLIKVLQQLTGVKIDHYAEVNLIGFYLLSDAIGGVPVCLLAPVKDRQSGADFPAGQFEVSGSQALSFVRQRHGLPGEDLARVRRQQAFLAGAADKILSVGTLTNPKRLANLVDAANRALVLDSGFDLLSFAQQMMNLSSGKITFTTIPTHGTEMVNGKSALAIDPAEIRGFFATLMTDPLPTTTGAPATTTVNRGAVIVDVQNGTETPGMAAQAGAVVAAAGFQRGQLTDYPGVTADNQQTETSIHYPAGGEAAAGLVKSVLKLGTVVADDAIPTGHLLVVVGTDMRQLPADQIPSMTAPPANSAPATSASAGASTTLPEDAIKASDVPCVN